MSSAAIPKTMKAIQVEEVGGPEKVVLNTIPVPTPKGDEVLIKVDWSGVNFIDTYFRSGLYPKPMPFTLGQDAVGTLVSLPASSDIKHGFSLGQRVLTTAGNAFAEYQAVPYGKIAVLPDDIPAQDGVGLATQAFTAAALVKESYEVKKGDWVLVRAAAGGIAKYLGAHVIGTTSTEEKAQLAKENGADHVVLTTNSSEDNVKEVSQLISVSQAVVKTKLSQILRLTEGKGVHVVYDGVGKDTWEEDFLVVRPKATIVTFGNASGAVPPFAPLKLSAKSLKVTRPTLGPFIAEPEDFARYASFVFDLYKNGGLKVKTHKVYDFTAEQVAQSQIDIASRGTTGKLLIHVSGET
ncbi:NADPH:quinone reductase, partial [Tremellales sp. Uapishka_1]